MGRGNIIMIVTGLGQCCLDFLALVDSYPEADTKKEAMEIRQQGGGPVATALVALSRLGVKCMFHGVVGDDEEGGKISRSLLDEGVDVDGLVVRQGARSQRAFIVVDAETAGRTIFWKRPTARPIAPEELGEGFLRGDGSAFVLLDGLMEEASLYAARKAGTLGVPVMLDAGRLRPGMLDIAGVSDYVVASSEFARQMDWYESGGLSPERVRGAIKEHGLKVVTVTLGEEGSVTVPGSGGEVIRTPAFKVSAVDTTGAGDVFHGGYIYGLLKGWDIYETLRFASAFAALKCRRLGGRAGIASLEETLEYIETQRKP
jgi:ribokinase